MKQLDKLKINKLKIKKKCYDWFRLECGDEFDTPKYIVGLKIKRAVALGKVIAHYKNIQTYRFGYLNVIVKNDNKVVDLYQDLLSRWVNVDKRTKEIWMRNEFKKLGKNYDKEYK